MQAPGAMRPPVGVHFDAAFGDNLDDLLALSLLYSLDNRNECRVIGMTTTKDNLQSAALYEVYQKMYGGRPTAIGMQTGKVRPDTSPLLKAAAEGQATTVKSVLDTAEPHGLIRNVLTANHDGNAVIICTGPTDNLRDLLKLQTARPVVAAKVRTLFLVGDAAKPIEDWPTPVVTVAAPAGLSYVAKAADFAWNEKHPAAQALAASPDANLNRAAMAAVLQAVRGKDFVATDAVLAELVAAKPIPRQRMRGFGV